jgi:hypothetical protein
MWLRHPVKGGSFAGARLQFREVFERLAIALIELGNEVLNAPRLYGALSAQGIVIPAFRSTSESSILYGGWPSGAISPERTCSFRALTCLRLLLKKASRNSNGRA